MKKNINFINQSFDLNKKSDSRSIVYSTLLIFIPVFIFIVSVIITVLVISENLEMEAFQNKEERIVNSKLENIQAEILQVTNDLMILALNSQMDKLLDGSSNAEIIESITEDFFNVAVYRKLYDQVRLIDENGKEVIRVNFNNGNPVVVAQEKLQNKKDRYYFYDAYKLKKDAVFVSPLDLNIEHGEIEQPLKPMMRFATPIFDKNGKKRGIVLLNYFGQIIINQLINEEHLLIESRVMLLNSDGYWFKGPLSEYEWGFMYEDKKDIRFENTYANAWELIKREESSQFETQQGMFTSKTIHPLIEGQKSSTGSGKAFLPSKVKLQADEYFWKIVSYIPSEILYANRNMRRKYATLLLAFLSISSFFILWRLAKTKYFRIKAQQELKESNVAKDKFFSIIAHDLKSPFNAMLGFSELLLKKFDEIDVQKQKNFINNIYESTHNTYKLLENLLLWSRSQRGVMEFYPESENLYLLTLEIIELLAKVAENKSINIRNEIAETVFVKADKNMLSTILRNLISNAIKFCNKGGEIIIEACLKIDENKQNYTEISVSDNGIGIESELQSKLFSISENVSTKGTENESGTGLGLILCKEFVEKHGGEIWVEGKLGKGSKFIFTIPATL